MIKSISTYDYGPEEDKFGPPCLKFFKYISIITQGERYLQSPGKSKSYSDKMTIFPPAEVKFHTDSVKLYLIASENNISLIASNSMLPRYL